MLASAGLQPVGLAAVFETDAFKKGMASYLGGLATASKETKSAATRMSGEGIASNIFSGMIGGVGVGLFNTAIQGVQSFASSLIGLNTQLIGNVGQLQQMSIALDSLAAKEVINAGITDDVNEAYRIGADYADQMLVKIKDISLESPFEYKTIVDTYRMAQAFGITSDLALDLTQGITNMTAGMGMSGEMMNRLIYNFGQMNRTGQISQRDIRDLAMAGVDLADVLDKQLGMSVAETNEALKSGAINFDEVTRALTDYSNAFFGGAAEKASRTLPGLISSFNDLMFFASTDIWGPATEVITGFLGGVFDKARELIDSGALERVGLALEVVAEKATGNFDVASLSMDNFFGGLNKQAMDAAANAFNWGANIILSFTEGFVQAISTVLIAAMNYLTSVLSSYLKGSSPPQVAPEIDVWGENTMNEYIKGMTKADFTALNSIQGPLKDALSLAVDTGLMGGQQSVNLFKSITSGITQLLSGGGGSLGDIVSQLSGLGAMADETIALVTSQIAYAQATEEAAKATDELNEAKDRSVETDEQLNMEIAKYNQMLSSGATQAELDAQMALIKAGEAENVNALEAIDAAEEREEAAKKNADALKDEFDLQRAIFDELLQLSRNLYQPPAAGGGGAGARGGLGGGGGGGGVGVLGGGGLGIDPSLFGGGGGPFEEMDSFATDFSTGLDLAFSGLGEKLDEIKQHFTDMSTAWTTLTSIGGEGGLFSILKEYLTPEKVSLLGQLAGNITVVGVVLGVIGAAATFVGAPVLALAVALGTLITVVQTEGPGLVSNWTYIWNTLPIILTAVFARIQLGWDTFRANLSLWWNGIMLDLATFGELHEAWWRDRVHSFNTFVTDTKKELDSFVINMQTWVTNVSTEFINMGSNLANWIYVTLPGYISDLASAGGDMISGFLGGLQGQWGSVVSWITGVAQDLIDAIRTVFKEDSPSKVFNKIGGNVIKGFKLGLRDEAQGLESFGENLFRPMIPRFSPAQQYNSSIYNNIYMGGQTVRSNLDLAALESTIYNILNR